MLHVNDDTNDELFRNAAEDYLLKAGKPDWNAVVGKIDAGDISFTELSNPAAHIKNKRHPFFRLFAWPPKKGIHQHTGIVMRISRITSWLDKSKKKIKRLLVAVSSVEAGVVNFYGRCRLHTPLFCVLNSSR